jgi:multidrug efflux system outer membrane protein
MNYTSMDFRPGIAVLLALALLAGCTVGPHYQRPAVSVPPGFRGAGGTVEQASIADLPWWEVFKDGTLKELIKTALAANLDLAIAATRVEQARQMLAEARAGFFPRVDYDTQLSRGRNQLLNNPSNGGGGATNLLLAIATVSWEADIWGRIRRLNEAAKADYLASSDARRGVMLSLVADVSTDYFDLLALQRKREISANSENTFSQTRDLFSQRLEGGVSSQLPVSRAEASQATSAAQVVEYDRQIALMENAINVLLGRNPGPIPTRAKLLDETPPPEIPAGLPSALLQRRPDVLAAEESMRAANARIGVATADFFPKLGLTAFFGKLSVPLENLTSSTSTISSIGATFAGPIFEGGRLKARKRESVAEWQQTKLEYAQTLLNAFRDVSNALISRERYETIRVDQAKSVQSYEEAVRLANMRYDHGFSSYYEVLEAQQLLFPAQLALAQTELDRRLVIVQLYKALGGGWKLTDEQFRAGTP